MYKQPANNEGNLYNKQTEQEKIAYKGFFALCDVYHMFSYQALFFLRTRMLTETTTTLFWESSSKKFCIVSKLVLIEISAKICQNPFAKIF